MTDYLAEANELFEYTRQLRRDFHAHPELGFQEVRTAGVVASELKDLGLEVTPRIAETGVVALLEGNKAGPVVLLRFDMDALPITEETGAEYASQTPGIMHACGHDGHTAIGLTVARLLRNHRRELAGTVKLVFQPAEEGLGGAERMVAEGVLENPRPDLALSLHIWNDSPLGWLGIVEGPVMAASEVFTVTITGKGGHGALPHLAVDPVLAAAHTITAVQSIVSRNVPPLKSGVVSFTALSGGEAFNVIPNTVQLKGTIRTFEQGVREVIMNRFEAIVKGVVEAMGCTAEIEIHNITPAVVNDPQITTTVHHIAETILPEVSIETNYQTMGSEDMAYFMQGIPGCYILIGSANDKAGLNAKHHNPRFNFDEQVLPRAAGLMAAATAHFLHG
jgi:amidohydrolase